MTRKMRIDEAIAKTFENADRMTVGELGRWCSVIAAVHMHVGHKAVLKALQGVAERSGVDLGRPNFSPAVDALKKAVAEEENERSHL